MANTKRTPLRSAKPRYAPGARPSNSVTRSISMDKDLFAELEEARKRLRLKRSELFKFMAEHVLGIADRSDLFAHEEKVSKPRLIDVKKDGHKSGK